MTGINVRRGALFLLALVSISLGLGAQEATVVENPSDSLAVVLVGAGTLAEIGGAVFLVQAIYDKQAYDLAFQAWQADNSLIASRDAASNRYYTNLLVGLGLEVVGIILTISGISRAGGTQDYQQVEPKLNEPGPQVNLNIESTMIGLRIRF